jgi:peptidoglycan-N-acetylglucosamine deacetylase
VALTFDDGPTPQYTRNVLSILRQQKVKATFFMLGQQAHRFPKLVGEVEKEGHLIASHSWDHPKRRPLEEWRRQLQLTRQAFLAAGVRVSPYFRPPHGLVNEAVTQACAEQGYLIVLYTVLSSDWQRPGVEALERQVIGRLENGGIVVLHDGGGDRSQTIEALPHIISGLRHKGLEPVRLDELLGDNPRAETCARAHHS